MLLDSSVLHVFFAHSAAVSARAPAAYAIVVYWHCCMSFPNIRRRLELELSNRSSSASRSPPQQDLEAVQFRSPKAEKELKTPERSSLRQYPEAQSRSLDFILTEQSILTSKFKEFTGIAGDPR